MDDILNLQQACSFLGVSERTIIKLLKEEHVPARKIGREWRFSKNALIEWISSGDSYTYNNREDPYAIYEDSTGNLKELMDTISIKLAKLNETNDIKTIVDGINDSITIPDNMRLSVSYKQKRDLERLSFKLYWPLRDDFKINP